MKLELKASRCGRLAHGLSQFETFYTPVGEGLHEWAGKLVYATNWLWSTRWFVVRLRAIPHVS